MLLRPKRTDTFVDCDLVKEEEEEMGSCFRGGKEEGGGLPWGWTFLICPYVAWSKVPRSANEDKLSPGWRTGNPLQFSVDQY